jgi:hypothetical protein
MFKCSNETGKFILEIFSNSVKITTNDYSPFKKKNKKKSLNQIKHFKIYYKIETIRSPLWNIFLV